jgi:5-methylcytosine-specific restriction endonuclease McrA
MPDFTHRHVLVLNKHWLAVHVCSVRRALSLIYQDHAQVVSDDYQTFDFEAWIAHSQNGGRQADRMLRAPGFEVRLPQVIVLRQYQKAPPRTIRFNRRNVYIRDGHQCQYCGRRPGREQLTIDHVVPRSRGGLSNWKNVVVACTTCNTLKGDRLPAECGMHPRKKPGRPSWFASLRILPDGGESEIWLKFVNAAAS